MASLFQDSTFQFFSVMYYVGYLFLNYYAMKYYAMIIIAGLILIRSYSNEPQFTFKQWTVAPYKEVVYQTQPIAPNTYTVLSVTDGDTISIDYHGKPTAVRFIGLDTPEKWTKKTGFEECYGKEASDYAKKFFSGKQVTLQYDKSQARVDQYGRVLAHVYVGDEYYEQSAIAAGYGFRFVFDHQPSSHDNELKLAEDFARKSNLWLWKSCWGKLVRKI